MKCPGDGYCSHNGLCDVTDGTCICFDDYYSYYYDYYYNDYGYYGDECQCKLINKGRTEKKDSMKCTIDFM